MRRVKIVILLIGSLLFLASCSYGGSSGSSSYSSSSDFFNGADNDFRTGSQGLELRFLPGAPPEQVYEGDPLDVVVEYKNRGAYNILNGRLYLSGFDEQVIQMTPTSIPDLKAEGKSRFNPLGQISDTAEFTDTTVSLPTTAESTIDFLPVRIMATACYEYKTFANSIVCIDPDPYGVDPEEKVCYVRDIGMGSQGAPVAVTSIEEEVNRDRIQFKVFISNVGSGTVIAPGLTGAAPIDQCHTRLERTDIDKVYIKASLPERPLICKPNLIRLEGGSGFSFCSYEGFLGDSAYQTALNVELSYGYRDYILTDVEIISRS